MIHIVSHAVTIATTAGQILRQRCVWCGTIITDVNLSQVAVAISDDDRCHECRVFRRAHRSTVPHPFVEAPYPTWAADSLVFKDGGLTYSVEYVEGKSLKDYDEPCCALLDPAVTA